MSERGKASLLLGGIDPGLASGGFVVIEPLAKDRVLASYSMVEDRGTAASAKKEAASILSEFEDWGDKEFVAAVLRMEAWIAKLRERLLQAQEEFGPISLFGVESFVDQPSRARQLFACSKCKTTYARWTPICSNCQGQGTLEPKSRLTKNIWQTPLLMGALAEALEQQCGATVRNHRVVYQNAGIVISQWGPQLAALKERGRGRTDLVVAGDRQVRNDHERKALVHALALSVRLRQTIRDHSNPDFINSLTKERN